MKKRTATSSGSPLGPENGGFPRGVNPPTSTQPTSFQAPPAGTRTRRGSSDHGVRAKPKKLQYYNIIFTFNPATTSRPTNLKESLKNAFLTDVRPLLVPYLLPAPAVKMDTDAGQEDFDPLGRKTTKPMLVKAILQKRPTTTIPPGATIDDILILYKHYVSPGLVIPPNRRFIEKPRTVAAPRLKGESMEETLLALRYYSPSVFVRSLAMNKECLIDLYIQFVLEETPRSPLIHGFHYTILKTSDIETPMDQEADPEARCIPSGPIWTCCINVPLVFKAMPPRHKKITKPHRVVCLCKSFNCADQIYPDANGVNHPGVEVLPETRAAHKRADYRNELREVNSLESTNVSTSSVQDLLVSPMQQLGIEPSPITSQHHQTEDEHTSVAGEVLDSTANSFSP
ncbi:uncharacterized protein MELLADRAFT_113683 [Melampsora larici-populina 98AG31]|uniref:Uncharacterized protein n=1 Tax=Melampsora larici-populina (strain 98AG31 / pathotype 3-4-7) TaxID=747676 RepID=F4SAR2_MELLP|nr:uncharacterized protein MELLADRAFT_113683 [Melampsora larici-populina 98AG31]EGF98273.1 hypothetical protein MELLADRAFT_113683 [Melampsora larici-populina 98AG31]